MKHILIISMVLLFNFKVSAQNKNEISTAEQMVVYNKQHNKPQYKGLVVIYNYEIRNSNPVKTQELLNIAESRFQKVIKAEFKKFGTKEVLSITTEGDVLNNKIYYDLLEKQSKYLIQNKRELLLK